MVFVTKFFDVHRVPLIIMHFEIYSTALMFIYIIAQNYFNVTMLRFNSVCHELLAHKYKIACFEQEAEQDNQ